MGKGLVEGQLESRACWQLSGVFTGATETKDPAKSPWNKSPPDAPAGLRDRGAYTTSTHTEYLLNPLTLRQEARRVGERSRGEKKGELRKSFPRQPEVHLADGERRFNSEMY